MDDERLRQFDSASYDYEQLSTAVQWSVLSVGVHEDQNVNLTMGNCFVLMILSGMIGIWMKKEMSLIDLEI